MGRKCDCFGTDLGLVKGYDGYAGKKATRKTE